MFRKSYRIYIAGVTPIVASKQGAQSRARSGVQSAAFLNALADATLSAAEIAARLGLDTKTGAFKRAIKELLQQTLIAYTIPEKPTNRLQKYRLTEKGTQEKGLKG
jgi:ATP-dependent DNA helicase RecG